MSVKNQQEKVKDVLAECEVHWLMNRIPEDKVLEMSSELEQHLREATRDGKPVQVVVGEDVSTFAESWAEEARPSMSLGSRLVEFAYLLCVMTATITTIYLMLMWTLIVPIRWFEVSIVLLNAACFSRSAIKPTPRVEPRWKRWLMIAVPALALVALIQGLSVVTLGSVNAVLLEWPWYATLLAVLAAIILSKFRQQSRSREEQA